MDTITIDLPKNHDMIVGDEVMINDIPGGFVVLVVGENFAQVCSTEDAMAVSEIIDIDLLIQLATETIH